MRSGSRAVRDRREPDSSASQRGAAALARRRRHGGERGGGCVDRPQPAAARRSRVPPAPAAMATPPGDGDARRAPSALDAAYVSDPRYRRERAALLHSLQAQLAAMPPPARAKVTASLATIEDAPRRISKARSARIRATRCCRSCWSTLTRMKCASSPTCAKPATLAGGFEHAYRRSYVSASMMVLCASAVAAASRLRVFDRTGSRAAARRGRDLQRQPARSRSAAGTAPR